MVGLHSVWVYPDPAAGGWSAPLASNAYFTSNGDGWRAIPFGSAFAWSGGSMVSTNPAAAYQALGRDPLYPVARPPAGTQWRIRADVTLPPLAPGKATTRVYLLVRFGRTANDAFQTPSGPDEATLFTWRDLRPGTHRLEAVFAPAVQPNPAFVFLSAQVTVDPTTAPISIGSIELAYTSGPGSDLSCLVDSVSIQHGRDDSASQPEASAATLELTSDAYAALPPSVDVGAVITVTSAVGDAVSQRFTGRITDVVLGWDEAGEATPDTGVAQIVAVGALADLGRRVVGDVPWPQELDGARVGRVMTAAGVTLDPFYSDPGTVQIIARDVDSTAALDAARDAATSASGVLWETRGGEIRYADSAHRRGIAPSLTLDACDLLVSPSWRRNLDGLVNDVSIGYGVEVEGGEQPRYVESNGPSITRWGRYGYTSTTDLAALVDAQTVARLLLARNSSPVWVMAALPIDVEGLDETRYLLLLGLDMHSLLTLTGLPTIGSAPTSAQLWVEGWREVLTYGGHEVDLVVSGYCRTAPPPRWDDMSPDWVWGGAIYTERRRNLITNPSIEVDLAGWIPSGSGTTIARQGGTGVVGGGYLRCTLIAVANTGAAYTRPATPGINYGARAMTRLNSALGVAARLQFLDDADAQLAITSGTTTVHPTSAWGLNTVEAVAPAGTASVRVVVSRRVAGTAGELLDIDAVALYAIPAGGSLDPTYFDGDTLDTATDDYRWVGMAHASESVQSDIEADEGGLPPTLTWDEAACLGPPADLGRWNDTSASIRWDQLPPAKTWDTYST